MKDYKNINWYSKERQIHYEQVNSSKEKLLGNTGEEIAKQWFLSNGYEVKDSTSNQDANSHADFYI